MTLYTVKEGEHDFKPNDQPTSTNGRVVDWEFQLDESMWFDFSNREEYPYGDYNGWNKLGGGLTWFFSSNSNRTCVLGWFPAKEKNTWDIVAYVNPHNGGWQAKPLATVGLGRYIGQTSWIRNTARFHIKEVNDSLELSKAVSDAEKSGWDSSVEMYLKRVPFWSKYAAIFTGGVYRGIGPWYGGQFPAFKDMQFKANFNYR